MLRNGQREDCDCLASESLKITTHYVSCPAAPTGADNSDLRCLAELAAWRDIDTAISIIVAHQNGRGK